MESTQQQDDDVVVAANGQQGTMPHESQRHNARRHKLWWLLVIILLLLLLLGGWLWWRGHRGETDTGSGSPSSSAGDSSIPTSTTPTATDPCAAGLTNYENHGLGLGFCYPTAWGSVTVTDGKFEAADHGSRWILGFAAKATVHLGVVSNDWSTVVPRDGTCVDPAVQTLPPFTPFSTTWQTTGTPVSSATRGIEELSGQYLIQESVDDLLTNGVCLTGYTIISSVYDHTSASYYVEFGGGSATPADHIAHPETLISAADRVDFAAFVKSVRRV